MEKVSFKEFLQALMKLAVKIVIGLFAIVLVFFLIVNYLDAQRPNPPEPKIKYGEFPFEITYEINGEVKTVQDVFVCKYDGINNTEGGKFRKWKGYFKSTGDENLVIDTKYTCKLCITVGSTYYYMRDNSFSASDEPRKPTFYIIDNTFSGKDTDEIIKEKFGNVKIINYKLSNPIENSFE